MFVRDDHGQDVGTMSVLKSVYNRSATPKHYYCGSVYILSDHVDGLVPRYVCLAFVFYCPVRSSTSISPPERES